MNKLIKGNKKGEKKKKKQQRQVRNVSLNLIPFGSSQKLSLLVISFSMHKILHCLVIDTLPNNHEPLVHSFYKLINFSVWFLTVEPSDPYGLQEGYQHKRYSSCLVIKHLKHVHSTLARREIDYQEILKFVTWYRAL